MQMIAQLDKPQQMVYIEVFITQVNKSNADEMGVQLDYAGEYLRNDRTATYSAELLLMVLTISLDYHMKYLTTISN